MLFDVLRKILKKKIIGYRFFFVFSVLFLISEVDINDVSISPSDEIENVVSDVNINIDNKIKRAREDNVIEVENKRKGRVLKKFEDENGRDYPLTGGKTGYDARVFLDEEND
jgi:hypothetical protein